jgi:hypothetical protein
MKKVLAVIAVILLSRFSFADPSNIGTEPPSAGWNFGNVTYAQEGGSLVLNSLSDRYGVSTFQTANTNGRSTQLLGTNDYIPESAVKNQLAIDGYTAAYDYNPNYKGLYASEYNQSLPTNVPLTELSFNGLAGDPTSIQNVYVPTSEYNALSAQGQAASINTLNNGLATTNASLAGTQNMTDNSVITNTVKANTAGIVALNTGLNNETVRAQGAEAGLQNQVNATNSKVANLDNRVDKLEQVKVMADLNVRILDTKKYTVGVFDMWDGTNNRNFAFGARLTYKLGKSYEEKVLEKQQLQIEALQRVLTKIATQN